LNDAYLLVTHGSRDPRPQIAVCQLAEQLSLWWQKCVPIESPILVATAQLELADVPLHVQISDFARECAKSGVVRVTILPLFLIPGVHAIEDIPAEVALAEREIGNLSQQVKLILLPFLGDNPNFTNLFARNRSSLPSRSIILGHGSRRSGGNEIVERLANTLDLKTAYWSVEMSLPDRVQELVTMGVMEIGILPYFLFPGGITDAIGELVSQLRQQYPQVRFILGEPIGNSPDLVITIGKILGSIEL
jgi:sirohydrochlorin cobaltochelatase